MSTTTVNVTRHTTVYAGDADGNKAMPEAIVVRRQ
jgi:hypothetical protein